MYKTEGYWNVKPKIKRLSFPKRGKFQVDLQDGRSIMIHIEQILGNFQNYVHEAENV